MSDHLIKLIPGSPDYCAKDAQIQRVLNVLKANIQADSIKVSTYTAPAFIDCGSNLERIVCPCCGKPLDLDWWGKAMDAASKNHFNNLLASMPCCKKECSLNDLQYDFPGGFACVEFNILNPVTELSEKHLSEIAKLLGSSVRLIHAHI